MLKHIPPILTPELLKVLMEMGHGDEIVIADGNFPGAAIAQRLIRLDGHGCAEVLDAILTLFPLDTYVDAPVSLMEVVPGDNVETPIWDEFAKIIEKHQPGTKVLGQLTAVTGREAPLPLASLAGKTPRFGEVADKTAMQSVVTEFLQ